MTRSEAFVAWLKENHCGKENAVKGNHLLHWGSRRLIRRMINELRRKGVPVCSDTDNGYYYAARSHEVKQTITFLSSYAEDLHNVIRGLNDALDDLSSKERR